MTSSRKRSSLSDVPDRLIAIVYAASPSESAIGQLRQRFANDPAVERRHQVVTLGGRYELVRADQFAVFVAHAQQQLVVAACLPVLDADTDDRLEEQFQSIIFHRAADARHPLHFFVTHRRVAVLVEVNLVATHVFRRVTGDVGRTHQLATSSFSL